MRKRILSIVLSIVMLVSLLPTTALALSSDVYIGGVNLGDGSTTVYYKNGDTSGKLTGTAEDYNAKLETVGGVATLTIKNLSVAAASGKAGIVSYVSLNLILEGASSITGGDEGSSWAAYGISVYGDLTISGDGSLSVIGGTSAEDDSYGIYVNGALTIKSGTINATGGTASGSSYGIYATTVLIHDGTVNATGGTAGSASNNVSCGIGTGEGAVISGGVVNATGGAAYLSYGIEICYEISGGTVVATGGDAVYDSFGITRGTSNTKFNGGVVVMRGGTVSDPTGSSNAYDSYDSNSINLNGTKIAGQVVDGIFTGSLASYTDNATAVALVPSDWESADTLPTSYLQNNTYIVNANADAATFDSNKTIDTGYSAYTLLVVSLYSGDESTSGIKYIGNNDRHSLAIGQNGKVIAVGGMSSGSSSCGINGYLMHTDNSASVIAIGGTAQSGSYGVYGNCFAFKTLTAIGGAVKDGLSCGFYAPDNAVYTTGNTTAIGGVSAGTDAADGSAGIFGESVTVGNVNAVGSAAAGHSYGIRSEGSVNINNDTNTANAVGGPAVESYGLYAASPAISHGTLNAIGGKATTSSAGLYISGGAISGGTVRGIGGTAANSYGLFYNGTPTNNLSTGDYTGKTAALGVENGNAVNNLLADDYGYFAGDTQLTPGSSATVGEPYQVVTVKEIPIPHEHPVCGAEHTDIGGHTGSCEDIVWTAVSTEADLRAMTSGGSYYLTNDIELTSGLAVPSINICLNGFELKQSANAAAITANGGVTLNICDCSDEHTGTIIGGNNNNGSGIFCSGYSAPTVLNVYGCKFTGCSRGAAIGLEYAATANLYGCTITGNNGSYGGVYSWFGPTLNIYGGEITNNTATYAGGGIWLHESTLYLSGNVKISGNTLNGENNNVHIELSDDDPSVVNIGAMSSDSQIGVTIGKTGYKEVTPGNYEQYVEFKEGMVSATGASYIDNFFSDVDKYMLATDGEGLKLVKKPTTCAVAFNANGGTTVSGQTVEYGSKIEEPTAPTKAGYTFAGWYKDSELAIAWDFNANTVTEPTTLYAKWTANTNTAYTVEHWQQNVERTGYVKVDTDEEVGTTGAETEAAAKTYTGFTAQSFDQEAIAADGSTVVIIYYNRNTYTVTYTDNDVFLSNVTIEDVVYGAKAPTYHGTTTRPGYTFGGWYKNSELTTAWNFENDTINGPTTIYAKWIEKNAVSITETAQTYTWDGNPKSFAITGTPNTGVAVQYKVNGNWTDTAPSAVGTYDVKITRVEDDTYKAYEKIITSGLVINAAAPNYAAPTAKTGLEYTGQPQELIAAAEVTGGTMYYALGGRYNPTGDWSTNVPTGTDAKTYYVWYKIEGDPGYTDVGQACVSVTIAKAPAATTPDSSSYTVNYAAETITFTNPYEVSTKNDGTGSDITSGSSVSALLGETIYIRTKATSTHDPSDWVAISIAARPAAPTGIVVTNETAAGQGNGSVTGITAEMEYKIGTSAWASGTGADLIGLAAGTQITVRVKATEAAPHGEEQTYTVSAGNTLTVTFDAQSGSAVAAVTGLSYNATITELPETTRTGYTFGGWWTAVNGGGSQLSVSTQITGNITYYAKWTPAALTGAVNISGTLQVGQTLTATVSGDNNTGALSYQWYRGEEAISEATGSTYTLKAADAGKTIKCMVSSTVQTGSIESAPTASIAKMDAPSAPAGLDAVAPSTPAANDGKITGVTVDMEYSADGTNWTACTGTEISGLGSGTYYVRVKETASTSAGASATVVVPAVYTVTFDANGGDPGWELVGVVSGQTANEAFEAKSPGSEYTAAQVFVAVRSGYDFAGWYTAAEGGVQFDFNAVITESITLYAHWSSEPMYGITGRVGQDAEGDGARGWVEGATVQLKQGNTVLFTKTTDEYGQYEFHAPAGTYNIVAEKDGKTMTGLIIVSDHDESVDTILLPYQNVSSKLTILERTPDIVVGGLDEEVLDNEHSDESSDTVHITLSMTVEQKEDITAESAPTDAELKAEQEEIKSEAGSQSENLTFFTIDLSKITTTNQVPGEPEEVTNTANLLEIIIPFETGGKQNFKVYRHHDNDLTDSEPGEVDVLTTTANADGEYIDVGNGIITIHARKFSTYAIGYSVPVYYDPSYRINVENAENGTVKANRNWAYYGNTVTLTVTPDEGCELDTLTVVDRYGKEIELTDKGDGSFAFRMPSRDVTVTAVFHRCPSAGLIDVDRDEWYHEAIDYVIKNGLMDPASDTAFDRNSPATRATLVAAIWRSEGSPVVDYRMTYTDLDAGHMQAEAIRWASSVGIVNGFPDGSFHADEAITREQLATLFYRYEQYKGEGFEGDWEYKLEYADADRVGDWAYEAVCWNTLKGIVRGDGTNFDPKGTATRDHVAQLLMNYLERN